MDKMEMLRERIIRRANDEGADLVGFGPIARFHDPAIAKIFPETKTVIAIGFRVLRGSYRGIEEGSTYYQYTTTGVETIEETLIPGALLRICAAIEDDGYLAVPQRRNQLLRASDESLNPEMLHTEFYQAGAKEPQIDFTQAAALCGLGEIGRSGALLTDPFGPFQRVALILTDAELPETPLVTPHLCDQCGECIHACPGHAMAADGTLNRWQCAAYYRGANMTTNPYMPPDAYEDRADRMEIMTGQADLSFADAKEVMAETHFYPPIKHGYVSSICGRACDRACYAHLEEKGVLTKHFVRPLRIRPVWSLPVLTEADQKEE